MAKKCLHMGMFLYRHYISLKNHIFIAFFAISALLPVYPYDIRRFHLHREVYFPFPPYKNHIQDTLIIDGFCQDMKSQSGFASQPQYKRPFFVFLRTTSFSVISGKAHLFFQIWFCILTFRETRACKEFSMRTIFYYHMTSALFTDLICYFIFNLNRF